MEEQLVTLKCPCHRDQEAIKLSSCDALFHLSSHGHLIGEIEENLRRAPGSRPEVMLEPFQHSLLSVLFIDFNRDRNSGQCWACGTLFDSLLDLSNHLKYDSHVGQLIQKIEKLLASPRDETMVYESVRRKCYICPVDKPPFLERDILEHVRTPEHIRLERKALKFQLNKTFTVDTWQRALFNSDTYDDTLSFSGLEDSASLFGGGNNINRGPEPERFDIMPPGFSNNAAGSDYSKSTTDRTGRLHNGDIPKPKFDSATRVSSQEESSSGYSSTHLTFPSSPSSASPRKPGDTYIKKKFDQSRNQYIWICDPCKTSMTGEAPVKQHLKAGFYG